jgi:hypothetical protein
MTLVPAFKPLNNSTPFIRVPIFSQHRIYHELVCDGADEAVSARSLLFASSSATATSTKELDDDGSRSSLLKSLEDTMAVLRLEVVDDILAQPNQIEPNCAKKIMLNMQRGSLPRPPWAVLVKFKAGIT